MTVELRDIRSELVVAELFCDVAVHGAVVMADAVLAQVISLKDPSEHIAGAVWWRVAELLRACTAATSSGSRLLPLLIAHALDDVEDVLNALTRDIDDGSHGNRRDPWRPTEGSCDALARTRDCCVRLARLMFTLDRTAPEVLATRVNQLGSALAAWHVAVLDRAVSECPHPL